MNPFSQLPAVKKDSKNGAGRKFFGPYYFVTALVEMSLLGTEGSVAVNSRYIQYYIVCTSRPYYIQQKTKVLSRL